MVRSSGFYESLLLLVRRRRGRIYLFFLFFSSCCRRRAGEEAGSRHRAAGWVHLHPDWITGATSSSPSSSPPHPPWQGQPLPARKLKHTLTHTHTRRSCFSFRREVQIAVESSKMLACTEMITMCLQSAKQEHLRRQQELDHNHNQGTSLVQDVSTLWFIYH